MKLTKTKQKQLTEAYDILIQVCLYDRPLGDMEPYLADDVMNFGAGKKEITKTKAAFLKQIKNQKKLAAGLKMDFQIKPVLRKITNQGTGAIYTDDIVNTVWINGVKNKLKFRLSFIFEYRHHTWIMLHSHTSTPDPQRSDDEVWPVEELKKRTAVLEKSLDEKIAELEIKNRELEIEAALERVRAVAMAMRKPDDLLNISEIVYNELIKLGFSNIRNAQIALKNDAKQAYTVFEYSDYTAGKGEAAYNSSPIVEELYNELGKSSNTLYQKEFSGKKFEDWRIWRKGLNTSIDSRIDLAESMCFYLYSIGTGHLGISTFNAITNEQVKILKRFKNVFELSYRRYTDVATAEAQARESQIQLALERVRARTMAMQRSDELLDVATVLFQQVKALGVPQWNCGFNIWSIGDKEFTYYPGSPDGIISPSPCKIPLTEHPVFKRFDESRKRGDELFVYEKEGEEQADHYRYMLSLPGVGDLLQSMLDAGFELPKFQVDHVANFSHGNLVFITYEHFPEMHDVFKRFAKVFEQTYTRFLDLQKAEAQAREAKIEAALEKVRAKAMSMHSSEDLTLTISLFFAELRVLNVIPHRCGVSMVDEETRAAVFNATTRTEEGETKEMTGKLILADHPVLDAVYDSWKKQEEYHPVIQGDEIRKYYQFMNPQVEFPYFSKDTIQFGHYFPFKEGFVFSWTDMELKEEELQIFRKFTSVLSLTHRRYMDLREAEAQAREAQIEASLERVRSKTMAMHNSQDVGDTVATLFDELVKLGVETNRCGILIYSDTIQAEVWTAKSNKNEKATLIIGQLDLSIHPLLQGIYDAWKNKESFYTYTMLGDDLKNITRQSMIFNIIQPVLIWMLCLKRNSQ